MKVIGKRFWFNDGKSDKIYGIYYNMDTGSILSVWGRRGKNLLTQKKTGKSLDDFDKIVDRKLAKGYREVVDGVIENNIKETLDKTASIIDEFQIVSSKNGNQTAQNVVGPFDNLPVDSEVKCVSNDGIDGFELGVAYLFKGVANTGNGVIRVEDMEGETRDVLKDRFEVAR